MPFVTGEFEGADHDHSSRYPSLYQINTRVWLTGLSRKLGWGATLDDVSDAKLFRLVAMTSDWLDAVPSHYLYTR